MAELGCCVQSGRKRKVSHQLPSPSAYNDLASLLSMEPDSLPDQDNITKRETSSRTNHCHQSWRERVAQWCYDVIDLLDAPRENVYVSMNILDRYTCACTKGQELSSKGYRLAAIASLFIALRLSASVRLKMQKLLQISQSNISIKEANAVVKQILKTLSLDKPILTPSESVRRLLSPFRNTFDKNTMDEVLEHAFYLVELSVCDQHFCEVSPSKMAYAALILSMYTATSRCTIDQMTCEHVLNTIHTQTGMNHASIEIQSLCSHLRSTYDQSHDNQSCSSHTTPTIAIVESYDDIATATHYQAKRPKPSNVFEEANCTSSIL